jgi:hypothetical protein
MAAFMLAAAKALMKEPPAELVQIRDGGGWMPKWEGKSIKA